MKRLLSLFIAVVMVASMCVFTTPAASAATLDAHNVGIEVPRFSGTTLFNELTGRATKKNAIFENYDEDVVLKEGTTDAVIRLDGYIDDGEWGTPIISIDSDYAAQMRTNVASAENTYYWHGPENKNGLRLQDGLAFDAWFAWDSDFLYIAAVVDDPDGPRLDKEGADVWNGDCLQFRIDPDGPNSVVTGQGYDASETAFPWASATRQGDNLANHGATEIAGGKVCNIGVAYAAPNSSSGHVAIYDMSPRYNPHREAVLLANGDVAYYMTKWDQLDAGYRSEARKNLNEPENVFGSTFAAVRPVSSPSDTNVNRFVTTYEIAVPWSQVNGSHYHYEFIPDETEVDAELDPEAPVEDKGTEICELLLSDYIPGVGDEFGISLALLNGAYVGGTGEYNSWLTWGSGICGDQMNTDDGTAGGSNSMVLSDVELGEQGCEHTFAPANCITPEKCTKCGYERGFATGHDYECEVAAIPAVGQDGLIVATCKTCGFVHNAVVEADNPTVLKHWEGIAQGEWSDYVKAYYDDYRLPDGTLNDEPSQRTFNPDGTAKTTYTKYNGEPVIAFVDGQPGTYFMLQSNFTTHSYKYNFRLTGLDETNGGYALDDLDEHYTTGYYHWFGGVANNGTQLLYGMNYAAGFFPTAPGSTVGKFQIREAEGGAIDDADQKILCESPEMDLGTDWHKVVFLFDDDSDTCFILCDDELMCATWCEGFDLGDFGTASIYDLIRRFGTSCMIKDMEIGNKTVFMPTSAPSKGYTVTLDGEVFGTFEEGETVELPTLEGYSEVGWFYRFYTWVGNADVERGEFSMTSTTPNGRSYTMVMPAKDVELTSDFVLEGDVDLDGDIGSKDTKILKKAMVGLEILEGKPLEAANAFLDDDIGSKDSKAIKKLIVGIGDIDR